MSWMDLFFSFDGRIARRQWWTGTLLLFAFSLIGSLALNPAGWGFSHPMLGSSPDGELLLDLAALIPATALNAKRFNDRGRPHWTAYAISSLSIAIYLAERAGLFLPSLFLPGEAVTPLDLVVLALVVGTAVFLLVDNGMLRGDHGPNRYGPDPLAVTADEARREGAIN